MLFGIDASQIVIILTLLAGLAGQFMSWKQHTRDALRDDYERQHTELIEERKRADELEPYKQQMEDWKLKTILAETRCREMQKELESLRLQVADLTKQIKEKTN